MSHEGIRIVSEETARRESAAEVKLPKGCGDAGQGSGDEDRRNGG